MNGLIINADDFGRTPEYNQAIEEAFDSGYINQTTLMVNMPYADDAVRLAKNGGWADKVGLHLNFSTGRPLTKMIQTCAGCCDENGIFQPKPFGVREWHLGEKEKRAVEEETIAQVEKYISYDLPLMHCDGHHHVHNRPAIAEIVVPILKRYGFKSVRNRRHISTRFGVLNPYLAIFSPWCKSAIRNIRFTQLVKKYGLRTTVGFGGWTDRNIREALKLKSYEIMVHPNYNPQKILVDVQDWDVYDGPSLSLIKEAVK